MVVVSLDDNTPTIASFDGTIHFLTFSFYVYGLFLCSNVWLWFLGKKVVLRKNVLRVLEPRDPLGMVI